MLNDFGFAVSAGTLHSFAGTLRFAPTSVLRSYVNDPASPVQCECWHDLESAVKLLFSINKIASKNPLLYRIDASDASSLLTYWEKFESILADWLRPAHASNYDVLAVEVEKLYELLH